MPAPKLWCPCDPRSPLVRPDHLRDHPGVGRRGRHPRNHPAAGHYLATPRRPGMNSVSWPRIALAAVAVVVAVLVLLTVIGFLIPATLVARSCRSTKRSSPRARTEGGPPASPHSHRCAAIQRSPASQHAAVSRSSPCRSASRSHAAIRCSASRASMTPGAVSLANTAARRAW